ncbi:uncharacterized protein [Typha angustifolia]|uniref:uncharacterized protein isoform X2 n=1 Tax=Typha angustifolia TaxID=59011 RepID=UPI003C2B7234
MLCTLSKVRAEKLVIEMDDVDKGIVMLAAQHGITELVMGAAGDKHCTNEMKIPFSKTALSVQQQVDPSCKIWFVCKGNLIYIREACPNGSTTAESHEARPISANSQSGKSISRSLPQGQVKSINLMYGPTQGVIKHISVQYNSKEGTNREASPHEKDVGADNARHNSSRHILKEVDNVKDEAHLEFQWHQIVERDVYETSRHTSKRSRYSIRQRDDTKDKNCGKAYKRDNGN